MLTFQIEDNSLPKEVPFFPCVAIIQARMGSTRLPGKVMMPICGKPLLEHQIDRLRHTNLIDQLVVATTHTADDDTIHQLCQAKGIHCFRGSKEDVLARFYAASSAYGAEVVVRITADCPLIDPKIISLCIGCFAQQYEEIDYLSNTLDRTFPRGMDTEVFKFTALEDAYYHAKEPYDKEHVTPYIYKHPERFRLANIVQKHNQSQVRLTVDEQEDLQLVKRIFEKIYPENPFFHLEDITKTLNQYPEWLSINSHIHQRN